MRFTPNKYLPVALALAAFAVAGAAPALAQPSGAWSAGISTRNARPYVESPSTKDNDYSAYAQTPAADFRPLFDYRASSEAWSNAGRVNIGH
jgi:hypothetical protein